jgi:aspartyl-tRNA(Asn)/glutamyl-tRNA(Gln) amidotransferase subunit B
MIHERFEMVVGLEVHVQLRTRTKAFCACSSAFGDAPNQNTCPVCLALPGALPVLNARAVELAVRAATALHCTVHEVSVFARKNYFYPDLPKGYQISQFDRPLATGGFMDVRLEATTRRIGITRVHMEEDAGKSIHDRYPSLTAIDLNRSGVPLIEIVSEPDMRSAAEAGAYLRKLKEIMLYADVSDVNMEKGSLRVDANISIRPRGHTGLGTKSEVKNMNSFSGVEKALAAEFERQCAHVASGGAVEQQTMLWDGARGVVRPARSKEGSHDYRYFPEPDLPPLVLTGAWIASVANALPELPDAKRERFVREYRIPAADAEVLTADPALADYFELVAMKSGDASLAANWIKGEVLAALNDAGLRIAELSLSAESLAKLIKLVRAGSVSNSAARRIFGILVRDGGDPGTIADREGLRKVGDQGALSGWIDEVLRENPAEAERFRQGEAKLRGVLVGLVMKKSRGSADPKVVNQLLSDKVKG